MSPELRIDPLTGLRVIVAGERGSRPGAFLDVRTREPIDPEHDPFAPGHEDRTPPEVFRLPGGEGWRVRVVPNLYPALSPDGTAPGDDPLGAGRGQPNLFASHPAVGGHEVIVNAPDPVHSLAEVAPEQVEAAMSVWRERMRTHSESAYVHVIVNEGKQAGASLPHTHAQLYALPFVPAAVARERERFTAYSDRTQGRNLLEDVLQEEVRRQERVFAIDAEAVAVCPFAARVPFHFQVVPRVPAARFSDDGPLGARLLHESLSRLRAVLGELPPLNLWVRTAPRGAERFCWRLEVMARLALVGGLEIGSGVHLSVLAAEDAARRLRDASDG